MSIDIKSIKSGPVGSGSGQPIGRAGGRAAVTPAGATSTAGTGAPAPAADQIHLTGAARTLAALQSAVASTPDIDVKRVEQLRQMVALGTYVPNPAKIAERMIQLDTDLAAATARSAG